MKRMLGLSVVVAGFIGVNVIATSPVMFAQAQDKPATQPAKPDDHEHAKFDLGTKKIGGFDVQVGQVAEAKAGEEAVFIVTVKGSGKPKALRAWVGIESGQGSIRTAAEEEKPGEWHAHHQVSKPIPNNSKLWIEVETASGKPKDSFDFKK